MQSKSQSFDVLIVGAGPAGLAAGIAAGSIGVGIGKRLVTSTKKAGKESEERSVCILERNSTPGRKFRLSGSGQCNVTHGGAVEDFPEHYGDCKKGGQKSRFVKPAIFSFDNRETVRFFDRHGVRMLERKDGKIFPRSLKSEDLLDVLVTELEEQGGKIRTNTTVKTVSYHDGLFHVETDRELFVAKSLILAAGGCSYPGTGSKGDGFHLAESLGHRIIAPRPGLTSIVAQNYPFAESAGISFTSPKIEVYRNGIQTETGRRAGQGDVLLTHRGLSGPGILDLSRFIEPDDEVRIAFCADFLGDERPNWNRLLVGKKTLKNALAPLGLPERFLSRLLRLLEISPEQSAAEVTREQRRRLESALLGFPFVVEQLGGWNDAMTTVGGVALDEIDRRTMQSRIMPGLFFCGEILDIDGDCGGYNIQFALSSGVLAGQSAIER